MRGGERRGEREMARGEGGKGCSVPSHGARRFSLDSVVAKGGGTGGARRPGAEGGGRRNLCKSRTGR